jgi:hypothetical protein
MCFFAKNYKIVSSNLKPRVQLGRQASKNEITNQSRGLPLGGCLLWVVLLKMTEVAQIYGLLFPNVYLFKNSSGHSVCECLTCRTAIKIEMYFYPFYKTSRDKKELEPILRLLNPCTATTPAL